jgi:hypothetical protein
LPIRSAYRAALDKLFQTRAVALLDDLRRVLKTQSRVTIFRVLKAVGYHNSYSHTGRYYTLQRIPKFDTRGLWHYRDIGFSRHGTLRATLVHLVEHSPAGHTHEELQEILHLRVHNTLRFLVETGQLRREQFQDTYVYLSGKRVRAAPQRAQRRKLALTAAVEEPAPATPGELAPAVVIDLLLDVIRHPEHDAQAVCRQLAGQGHRVTPEQVESVFGRYDLKKTLRSRSQRWRP